MAATSEARPGLSIQERSVGAAEGGGGSARPRVLILVENNSVPADRRVWAIATALSRAGWEVVVVGPQGLPASDRASFEVREGIDLHRYEPHAASGGLGGYVREYCSALWSTWRLVRRLTRERPFDAVHVCNPPDFLVAAAWPARRAGARVVFDHHDLSPELFQSRFEGRHRWLQRGTLTVERASLARADIVLATNESYRDVVCERSGKRREDVFVVRNGPDLRRFAPVAPDPALKRDKPLLLGYVGLMAAQDGVDHALHALALLRGRREDWRAIFGGEGDVREDMIRLSEELGLADLVEFPGWLENDQIVRLLSTCDVCLSPEPPSPLNEVSTMIKIAEYMAMGRPIVSYRLRESAITAGDAASYAEPGDVASFAERLDELLGDPARREAMGRIGRERVARELSWEHSERTLLGAYERLLQNGAQGPARAGEVRAAGASA